MQDTRWNARQGSKTLNTEWNTNFWKLHEPGWFIEKHVFWPNTSYCGLSLKPICRGETPHKVEFAHLLTFSCLSFVPNSSNIAVLVVCGKCYYTYCNTRIYQRSRVISLRKLICNTRYKLYSRTWLIFYYYFPPIFYRGCYFYRVSLYRYLPNFPKEFSQGNLVQDTYVSLYRIYKQPIASNIS